MAPANATPLAAIAALAGGAMSGQSLEGTAEQLYRLSLSTGYRSLATLAQGLRELNAEIENENRSITDGTD